MALVATMTAMILAGSIHAGESRVERSGGFTKSGKSFPIAGKAAEGSSNWEVHRDITIQPGKDFHVDSDLDYSSAGSIAVSLRSTLKSPADLGTLTMEAYWSVPDADTYQVAETKHGADFPYTNTGGAVFQVYGSQLRILLRNEGEGALAIQELVIFSRSR